MLFNSLNFAFFLPIVFVLYWLLDRRNKSFQNILLLGSSYFFYACWDWRFLFLLIFSTLLDYFSGIKINNSKENSTKKFWLWLSIIINLGFLGIFKYYNFFAISFAKALSVLGLSVSLSSLQVILPIGISFYTFHGLSYVFDLYKNKIQPERNIIDYSLFVSFFPLLVAGPIERATHLLPQLKQKRIFNYDKAVDGLRQILWGLFKKIVIADNCAGFANDIFANAEHYSGSTLVIGALFFAFQIYCDFSGYSDIALGTAKLFGIDLLKNFAFPYFSRDMAEFWRRWHISLSSWFKDYLYIPLGGSKGGMFQRIRNIFIIFLVSGFWHGANWTFLFWGFLNALFIMPSIILNTNRSHLNSVASGRYLPNIKELLSIVFTFSLTVLAWIFFRSSSLSDAFNYIGEIGSRSLFTFPEFPKMKKSVLIMALTGLLFTIEWIGRESNHALECLGNVKSKMVRWGFYLMLGLLIFTFGNFNETEFIYFAF